MVQLQLKLNVMKESYQSTGQCSFQESYIGETVRNVEIRWQDHEDTQKPAKHLKHNPTYSFA